MTYGIHPHETSNDVVDKQKVTPAHSENDKIIGIGETGLDFFYNYSDKDKTNR